MKILFLYFNTLKYLKPIQVIFRIKKYLFPVRYVHYSSLPSIRQFPINFKLSNKIETYNFKNKEFSFINLKKKLTSSDWTASGMPKLWIYNLHYFDFINSKNSLEFEDSSFNLIKAWIAFNKSTIGLEPYPLSLRIVNWVKWLQRNKIKNLDIALSLANQTRHLVKNIEYHLLGNHLFTNAKALIFSGLYFESDESDKWFNKGIEILKNEMNEQILEDGGSFELSPMYHAILLEDLLDIFYMLKKNNRENIEIYNLIQEKVKSMIVWIESMSHPDGDISFFNDCAFGISKNYSELFNLAVSMGIEDIPQKVCFLSNNLNYNALDKSGYISVNSKTFSAILDVAKVGPDYIPGHAHADTLSFELSIYNERVFVNGGTSTYEDDESRYLERSTSSHNTLELNGRNSSEVWSSFRVARRANPQKLKLTDNGSCIEISCEHDGYTNLDGDPFHKRTWVFSKNKMTITDEILTFSEEVSHISKIRFRVHPNISVIHSSKNTYKLTIGGKDVLFIVKDNHSFLDESLYAMEFNKKVKSKTICIETLSNRSEVEIIF